MSDRLYNSQLRETVRLLTRRLGLLEKSEASCCDVTLAQCHAIVEIARAGQISLNDLAELLCLDKSTVSRSVDNLVAGGLVERQTDPADRRCLALSLTNRGREVLTDIETRMENYFVGVIANIPAADRQRVIDSLELLARAACQPGSCDPQPPCSC